MTIKKVSSVKAKSTAKASKKPGATPRTRKKPAGTRTRKTYVRATVLSLLKGSKLTRDELQSKVGCASSALDRNLKILRDQGLIIAEGTRPLQFSLKSEQAAVPASAKESAAKKSVPKSRPATQKADLRHELDQFARRNAPKAMVAEKVLTLKRLAEAVPPAVAKVLKSIVDDYAGG